MIRQILFSQSCRMARWPRSVSWACLLLLVNAVSDGRADENKSQAVAKIDFEQQIQPLLQTRCVKCHGPRKQEGRLRLDARSIVLEGGVSGPALDAGKPGKSLIFQRVMYIFRQPS